MLTNGIRQNNTVSLQVGLSQTLSWLIIASWTQPRKEKKEKKEQQQQNSHLVSWLVVIQFVKLRRVCLWLFLTEFNTIMVFLLSSTQH